MISCFSTPSWQEAFPHLQTESWDRCTSASFLPYGWVSQVRSSVHWVWPWSLLPLALLPDEKLDFWWVAAVGSPNLQACQTGAQQHMYLWWILNLCSSNTAQAARVHAALTQGFTHALGMSSCPHLGNNKSTNEKRQCLIKLFDAFAELPESQQILTQQSDFSRHITF